jgi:hypothetical protein
VVDRRPQNNPRPERIAGQERQHLLLTGVPAVALPKISSTVGRMASPADAAPAA